MKISSASPRPMPLPGSMPVSFAAKAGPHASAVPTRRAVVVSPTTPARTSKWVRVLDTRRHASRWPKLSTEDAALTPAQRTAFGRTTACGPLLPDRAVSYPLCHLLNDVGGTGSSQDVVEQRRDDRVFAGTTSQAEAPVGICVGRTGLVGLARIRDQVGNRNRQQATWRRSHQCVHGSDLLLRRGR